jgi:endonuclease/exonuclease/phosphatase family metal-dependent hydrolase
MLDASLNDIGRDPSRPSGHLIALVSVVALLAVLAILSLNKAHYTTRTLVAGSSYPIYSSDAILKVVTLNIHAGLDATGRDRVDDVAELIAGLEPDLVGLQEVRRRDPATHRVLQDVTLSSRTNMVALFQPLVWLLGPTQGNAVLSRAYPQAENSLTLTGGAERRGVLLITVRLGGTDVDFINIHFGLSPSERSVQLQTVIDLLMERRNPAIVVGDFNVSLDSEELKPLAAIAREAWDAALVKHGDGYTFPAANPRVRIDQIWVYGPLEVLEAGVIETDVSDHLPSYASIRLRPLL